MVIKISPGDSPGGESAGGGRSTSKSTCVAGVDSDCSWRSTSLQYVQIQPGVNSDLGNGSFWVEIRDAEHVELMYASLMVSTDF